MCRALAFSVPLRSSVSYARERATLKDPPGADMTADTPGSIRPASRSTETLKAQAKAQRKGSRKAGKSAKRSSKGAKLLSPEEIREVFRRFSALNPEPKGELEYTNPFTLLVAVVLSA